MRGKKTVQLFAENPIYEYALNINVPAIDEDKITGIKVAPQGKAYLSECFEKHTTPRGEDYHWLASASFIDDSSRATYATLLKEGNITVTLIRLDMSCHCAIKSIADKIDGIL